ncbi:hypothetical protein [Tardiphaga sp. 813_E8_N1_3]
MKRILVVDDDPLVSIRLILEREGIETVSAMVARSVYSWRKIPTSM